MMSQKIKILLIHRNLPVKGLAEKLGCTSANLTNKFRRDNFSEKELSQIAELLDCDYEASFVLHDTGERI